MKHNSLIKKTKAISPVIATLLLIAIAVAASVITYSWVMNMINTQSSQAQTSIKIDNIAFIDTNTTAFRNIIKVTVRNTGSVTCRMATIYIKNTTDSWTYNVYPTASSLVDGGSPTSTIASGSTQVYTISIRNDPTFVSWKLASQYTIRVTTDGGFPAEDTPTTPSIT